MAVDTAPRSSRVAETAHRLLTSDDRLSRWVRGVAMVVAFVGVSVAVRGAYIADTSYVNQDEAEIIAGAMAAQHSPVPFTTWTTATTGPVWTWFLALLGALGLPLTLAFAHLLAAVLVGVIGVLAGVLARRSLGPRLGLAVAAFLFLPLALAITAEPMDIAALETELLPVVLILGAAAIPPAALRRRPWLFAVSGLLTGLALGAKYQVLPIALALLAVQLAQAGDVGWRVLLRRAGQWTTGVAIPAVIVVGMMVLTPGVSWTLLGQTMSFLSYYSAMFPVGARLWEAAWLVTADHILLLVAFAGWLAVCSTRRVAIVRVAVLAAGPAAVLTSAHPFGHHLLFVYAAIVLAISLPVRPGARVVPVAQPPRRAATVAVVAAVGWLLSFGPTLGHPTLTSPGTVRAALSASTIERDPRLAAACPPGSTVMIWGASNEYYLNYSWRNAIPFFNTTMWVIAPENRQGGLEFVQAAIENPETTCVFDALGRTERGVPAFAGLTESYPELVAPLSRDYRVEPDLIDCDYCVVYVRVGS